VASCFNEDGAFTVHAFLFPNLMMIAGLSHISDWCLRIGVFSLPWWPEWQEWARPFSKFLRYKNYRLTLQD
jgi:hypothetical protein